MNFGGIFISNNIIVIGVSTGGPKILGRLFTDMPKLNAGVILVQHMPKFINDSLRSTLSMNTDMTIKIAEDNDTIEAGNVYIAPSEIHLELEKNSTIKLCEGEKVNSVRPSIDVAMKSIIKIPRKKIVGVLLTGMGKDGAEGISHIKTIGGTTIAEDEGSCVIYAMPKAAIATGDVDFVMKPEEVREKLIELVGVLN